jgi:hypothetical protein
MFKLLEKRHPAKFGAIGRPSLIMNNSLSTNISFMRFLFKKEFVGLNDPLISRLGNLMRVYLVLYLIGFAFLFFGVPFGYAA